MAEAVVAMPVPAGESNATVAEKTAPAQSIESDAAGTVHIPTDTTTATGLPSPPLPDTAQTTRVHGTRTATGNAPSVKREREWPGVNASLPRKATSSSSAAQYQRDPSVEYQGPPTPVSLPSFVQEEPASSDDEDSSSDEDDEGEPKPPRAPRLDSKGRVRPTPAYYYDPEYDISGAPIRKRGRRGGMKGIPVFEPSMEDFGAGFYDYVKRIEKYGMRSGIVKVVPPKEWSNKLPNVSEPLRKIRLKNAIEQHMVGSSGLYRVTNVAKSRVWNPAQWKETSETERFQTPDFIKDARDKGERGTRSTVAVQTSSAKRKQASAPSEDPAKSEPTRRRSTRIKTDADEVMKATTPASSSTAADKQSEAAGKDQKKKKPLSAMAKAEPTDAEWAAFMKKYDALPHGMKKEDYTIDIMREIERRYWRGLVFGNAPMYGADMAGSIFDDKTKAWNVAHLGDLLPQLAPQDCQIPGVVSPYLYFGMWRATFAWHVEDADLYSINYIHFGAPKFWYAIPQEQSHRFERVMEGWFPTDRAKCNQFMRHKAFLASPHKLAEAGVTLNRCVQLPGEFILTYPRGYHSGFNVGFNCAESINFATERWLAIGKEARSCTCVGDSVSINVEAWLHEAAEEEHQAKDPSYRKRPYEDFVAERDAKRRKIAAAKQRHDRLDVRSSSVTVAPPPAPKEPKMTKKAQAELELQQKLDAFVCALCPDKSAEGLVEVREPGVAKSSKTKKAHRVCVMFTPSTWIDTDPETGAEIVRGYDNIEKARWKLKCQLCPEKYGCKVQCTRGKCIKAFHVTCALKEDSGIFIDATVVDDNNSTVSMLDQARAEVAAEKTGAEPIPSKVAIPHREAPVIAADAAPPASSTESALPVSVVADADAPDAMAVDTPADAQAPMPSTSSSVAPALVPAPAPTAEASAAPVGSTPHTAAVTPKPPVVVDVVSMGNMYVKVLCRQHNPAWQKLEAERKANELKQKVLDLKDNEMIGVRTPAGVFEVTLTGKNVEREIVSVVFGDGKRSDIKWKNILWIDAAELKLRQEATERARQEKDKKMYVYNHRPIKPTQRSLQPPLPVPGYGPYGFAPRWQSYPGQPVQPYGYPYPPAGSIPLVGYPYTTTGGGMMPSHHPSLPPMQPPTPHQQQPIAGPSSHHGHPHGFPSHYAPAPPSQASTVPRSSNNASPTHFGVPSTQYRPVAFPPSQPPSSSLASAPAPASSYLSQPRHVPLPQPQAHRAMPPTLPPQPATSAVAAAVAPPTPTHQ